MTFERGDFQQIRTSIPLCSSHGSLIWIANAQVMWNASKHLLNFNKAGIAFLETF